ncbi:MAG TPA: SH3 domain-containing protein [Roseimicrobium sp.]|nr:SH3 domain-containing protein [Roseimicrobium sp.]
MKPIYRPGFLAILTLGLAALAASAQEVAIVKGDRVNVRGQATVNSEVVTQLRKDEKITILGEINVEKPKPGEPAKWLKISVPTNTPVWVNTAFLTNHTVIPKLLNVRSGPGEHFSVIARLEKEATVQEIRVVDNWMEIVAPTNASAFVAADLIDRPNASATVSKVEPAPASPVAKPAPAPAPITETVKVDAAPAPAPVVDAPAKPVAAIPAPAPATVIPVPAPAPVVAAKVPADVELQPIPSAAPAPKRIITREGIVRRSISIQAPSAFRLADPDTGDTMNYLYPGDTGLQVKYYLGKRIRVSGEEAIDRRWLNTPVITIQTLEPLP